MAFNEVGLFPTREQNCHQFRLLSRFGSGMDVLLWKWSILKKERFPQIYVTLSLCILSSHEAFLGKRLLLSSSEVQSLIVKWNPQWSPLNTSRMLNSKYVVKQKILKTCNHKKESSETFQLGPFLVVEFRHGSHGFLSRSVLGESAREREEISFLLKDKNTINEITKSMGSRTSQPRNNLTML